MLKCFIFFVVVAIVVDDVLFVVVVIVDLFACFFFFLFFFPFFFFFFLVLLLGGHSVPFLFCIQYIAPYTAFVFRSFDLCQNNSFSLSSVCFGFVC